VKELFPATPRQRCLVHKQRNVLNAIPRRVRQDVETELVGIWAQPTKEGAMTQLAAFKAKYGKLYPEAVRSLAEEEDKTSLHQNDQCHRESLQQRAAAYRPDRRVHH
jgi:transposase-like protein